MEGPGGGLGGGPGGGPGGDPGGFGRGSGRGSREGSGRRVPREGSGAINVGFLLVLNRFSRKML